MNSNPTKAPVQRPLLSVERTRALVGLDTVISELVDYNEDEVLTLIFDHWCLGPAWNIASRSATKRELRVLMQSVRAFKLTGGESKPKKAWPDAYWLPLICPHNKPFFTGQELQQMLNCKGSHVINLIAEGSLSLMPGASRWRPGRGGSPIVSRESVVKFLTERQEI